MTTTDPTPEISVSTQLLNDYRLATPVSGVGQVCTAKDGAGVLHLFSIGSDGRVYEIHPDIASDTGWTRLDLGFPGGSDRYRARLLAAGTEPDGTVTVFACDAGERKFYQSAKTGGAWRLCFFHDPATVSTQAMKVAPDAAGNLILTEQLRVQAGGGSYAILAAIDYTQPEAKIGSNAITIGNTSAGPGSPDTQAIYDHAIAVWQPVPPPFGPGAQPRIWMLGKFRAGPGQPSLVNSRETPYPNGEPAGQWLPAEGDGYRQLCVVRNPNPHLIQRPPEAPYFADPLIILVVDADDHSLSWYDFPLPPQNDWEIPQPPRLVKLSGDIPVASVSAQTTARGTVEVLGLGQDGYLYHLHQAPDRESGWGDMIQINGVDRYAQVLLDQDVEGNLVAFGVTVQNELHRIGRDPDTTDWTFEKVELGGGPLETIRAYRVEIVLRDGRGPIDGGAKVSLWSSSPVAATVNGAVRVLGDAAATEVEADAGGRLVIVVETETLDAPILKIHTPHMADEERVTIEPNAYLQDKVADITADQLLEATDSSGRAIELLKGKYKTTAVAQALADALRGTMALTGRPEGRPAAAAKYIAGNRRSRGLRYVAQDDGRFPTRIDLGAVADQHWRLDFSTGVPVFSTSDRDTLATLMARRRAGLPRAGDASGLDVDWGDIWNSLTNTVAEIVEVAVSSRLNNGVVESIETQILLDINGVQHVFDTTIALVEQAFDMMRGVLQKVELGVDDLFNWLAYLLDPDDIRRTADVMAHVLDATLDYMVLAVNHLKAAVDAEFDRLVGAIAATFDAATAAIPEGLSTIGQAYDAYIAPHQSLPAPFDDYLRHNVLLDALLANPDDPAARSIGMEAPRAQVDPALQALADRLAQLVDELGDGPGKKAFDDAIGYFAGIGDDPERIFQLLLQGLLKICEGLAIVLTQALKAVVDAMFDAIAAVIQACRDLLTATWTIPLVSEIYQEITGRSLEFRLIDLISLIVAIPLTPCYKAATGEAPYPDQQSVDALKSGLTAGWLATASGIASPPSPGAEVDATSSDDFSWMRFFRTVSIWGYIADMATRAVLEARIHFTPWSGASSLGFWPKVNLAQRFFSNALSIPWIMKYQNANGGGTLWPIAQDLDARENTIWIAQFAFGPGRGVFHVLKGHSADIADKTMIVWGACHGAAHIAQAVAESKAPRYDPRKTAENTLHWLFPQFLRFLRSDTAVRITRGIFPPAYGVLTFPAEVAIVGLHYWRFCVPPPNEVPDGRAAARDRLT